MEVDRASSLGSGEPSYGELVNKDRVLPISLFHFLSRSYLSTKLFCYFSLTRGIFSMY